MTNTLLRSIVWLIAFIALLTASPSFALFEGADEEEIGQKNDKLIVRQFGLYDDPKIQKYVSRVGRRVLRQIGDQQFEYSFKVLDTPMVNAFALPGGYIYVTRGLLATISNEATLANILGHEIGHVIGHHSVKRMKQSLGSTFLTLAALMASQEARDNAAALLTLSQTLSAQIISGYGREYEIESDQVGMIASSAAGYDPKGMSEFLSALRRMERLKAVEYHGFLASHPDTITRIIEADQKAEFIKVRDGAGEKFKDRYLEIVDGLHYGNAKTKISKPPYTIKIHTVKKGETYRSIAKKYNGDEAFGIEIAALNNDDINKKLVAGNIVKTITRVKLKVLELREDKGDEIGSGVGDGKGEPDKRPDKTLNRKSEKPDSGNS